MTKKADLWLPLYVGDWLRKTARLPTIGHGAYLLLIMDCWVNGPLPDNDDALATVARMPVKEWKRLRPLIEPHFTVADGTWRHNRVDEEREKAQVLSNKRRRAGKEGADKRWQDDSKTMANAMADECQTPSQNDRQSQSPSPEKKEKPEAKASGKKTRRKPEVPIPPDLVEAPMPPPEWIEHANRKGIPDVRSTFEAFKDRNIAKGFVYADWFAAWRTWCRNELKYARERGAQGNGQRPSPQGGSLMRAAEMAFGSTGGEQRVRDHGLSPGWPDHGGSASGNSFAFESTDPTLRPGSGQGRANPMPVIDQEPVEG